MNEKNKKYDIHVDGSDLLILGVDHFDPNLVFDCGQCFRFRKIDGIWQGVAMGRLLRMSKDGDTIRIYDCDLDTYERVWKKFLGLSLDYSAVCESFDPNDAHLVAAAKAGKGIRILSQDPWEALVSFIISQNNNIPRITTLVERLCESCGSRFAADGEVLYAFPTPDEMSSITEPDYAQMGMGYRASYLVDVTRRVREGTLDLRAVSELSTDELIGRLMEVKGVGMKVASCAALFGFAKYDAFPIDVWVKRILAKYYPEAKETPNFGKYAGIAQQYLFYYERYLEKEQ